MPLGRTGETHKVDYSAVSHEALDCIFSNREHGCVGRICRQKELFLIPDLGNYILKVSLESFQAEEVKINEENEKNASGINSKVLLYENNIYCHMQCHNGIVCINSENEADVLDTKLSLDFYEKNYNLSNEIGKIIVEDGYCYDFRDLCKLKHGQEEIGNEINHGVLIHTEITRK